MPNLTSQAAHTTSPMMSNTSTQVPTADTQPTPASYSTSHRQPFVGRLFRDINQVRRHVEVAWFPTMRDYGVPRTDREYMHYVYKITTVLSSVEYVWDEHAEPSAYEKVYQTPSTNLGQDNRSLCGQMDRPPGHRSHCSLCLDSGNTDS
jgi:hypothetical protein